LKYKFIIDIININFIVEQNINQSNIYIVSKWKFVFFIILWIKIYIYEKLYINVKNMMKRDRLDIGIIEQLDEQWERARERVKSSII